MTLVKVGLLALILLLFAFNNLKAQGSLLLIGGGSEKDTPKSWNHEAYTRAVSESNNKRVAIISFGTATEWLPSYFTSQCGAKQAKNFDISTHETANNQVIYDSLVSYNVVFLKGGDQFNYYNTYRNTKTHEAIAYVYETGGVICGTSAGLAILGGVVFTAEKASVLSTDALKNPLSADITLADDMFAFIPDILTDSHFTRRGRAGRLMAFMANRELNGNPAVMGLGVDEMTALFIDKDKVGTAFGIGTVNLYRTTENGQFKLSDNGLLADNIIITQLLQGCTYHFTNQSAQGFTQIIEPIQVQQQTKSTLLLSGSDNLVSNEPLLNEFLVSLPSMDSKILVITGSSAGVADVYRSKLVAAGASQAETFQATLDKASSSSAAELINTASGILFQGITLSGLKAFIAGGQAGTTLSNLLTEREKVVAFIGENSRFVGKQVVSNYLESDAAYYGKFKLETGLNLISGSVIIPNTFYNEDFYENTAAAVPYAMISQKLALGFWLSDENFLKYKMDENGNATVSAVGTMPVMMLKHEGGPVGLSEQTAYGDGLDNNPHYAGFNQMKLFLLGISNPFSLGVISGLKSTLPVEADLWSWLGDSFMVKVPEISLNLYDLSGRLCLQEQFAQGTNYLNPKLLPGLYLIEASAGNHQKQNGKIIIH